MVVYELFQISEDNKKHKNYSAAMIEIDESLFGFDRFDTDSGIPLTKWNDKIVVTYEYKENRPVTDYVTNMLSWFIITEKFKDILISMGVKDLQFHPIMLK